MSAYEKQARLIKAMAHPARLHILQILSKGESCVCHLTTILKRRQPYVSQHLMTLRQAGLVKDRKDGPMVYYRLADQRIVGAMAITRELLAAAGVQVNLPEIPVSPVPGCPCPKCASWGYSSG